MGKNTASDHTKINSIGGLKNTGFSVNGVISVYLVRFGKNTTIDHVKVNYLG